MVTKKTSNEDVKKVSAPVSADVKKPTAKKAKTVAAKPAEAKVDAVVKTPAKTAAVKKTTKTEKTPATADKDVVASVLEIKAKNEAKKVAKSVKAEPMMTAEKGAKAVSAKSKRDNVKENAQKAEARKFMELKEEVSAQENARPCGYRKNGWKEILTAWVDGYRNIFNYKSRTSRFDFWSFMLVNFLVTLLVVAPYDRAIFNAQANNTVVSSALVSAYWIFTFVEFLVYLPLFVRRLHDINYSGWKGYFRQLTYLIITLFALMVLGQQKILTTDEVSVATTLWSVIFLAASFFTAYYMIKIFVTAGFIEGDYEDNEYGAPTEADRFCKRRILRMASTYILLATTYLVVTFCIQMSFQMRDYCYMLLFD